MDLPAQADAMYKTWWSFANYAANAREADGSYSFTITDAASAASQINQSVYAGQGGYNPIGLSQLFSVARKIGNASASLAGGAGAAQIDASMVAEAPWSRPLAEQVASPQWQARITMTYTDSAGVQQDGTTVVIINQVLPSSIASLQAQMELRVQDQLSSPPGTGTPRQGTLDSVDSITLMSVLADA